jgi:hypothetical protein
MVCLAHVFINPRNLSRQSRPVSEPRKAKLLMVLERPDVPLHTNTSESDIRTHVTRRKVSGGTRMEPPEQPVERHKAGRGRVPDLIRSPKPERPAFCPCYRSSYLPAKSANLLLSPQT